MIRGVWKVANGWEPFGTWGKSTEGSKEGSLSQPGYEPEDKANEGSRNKWVGHVASCIGAKTEVSGGGQVPDASDRHSCRHYCTGSVHLYLYLFDFAFIAEFNVPIIFALLKNSISDSVASSVVLILC